MNFKLIFFSVLSILVISCSQGNKDNIKSEKEDDRLKNNNVENDIIKEVRFIGGCMGNTQGVAALAKGRNIDEVINTIKGIDCGGRGTSCPDQLALALIAYKEQQA